MLGEGGEVFPPHLLHATLIKGVEIFSKIIIISTTTGTEAMVIRIPLITVPLMMVMTTGIEETNVIPHIITTIEGIIHRFRCHF
jgi:hypothetical protein